MPLIPIQKTSNSYYCEDDEGDHPSQPSTSQALHYGSGSTRRERIEMRDYGGEYGRSSTHGISNLGYDGEDYGSSRQAAKRDSKRYGRDYGSQAEKDSGQHATDQDYGRRSRHLREDTKKYETQSMAKQGSKKPIRDYGNPSVEQDYGNRSRESSNRRSESEDKIIKHIKNRFRATSAPRETLKSKNLSLIINPLMSSSYHSINNKIKHSQAIIRDKERTTKHGKLTIKVQSRSRSRSESEPFQRETSEPRYVEWSDYVMRSYEHLPTLAYSTFHEFRKKDEKIHCKITIYDNSWYSEQKAFALAFIMKSSEMYFTGSGFDEDFETDHRERSPAIDTFRKVGRSFFEKIGLVAKRRDLVHETAPADELPEYPLDDFCKRPIEFFHEEKKFSFDDLLSAKEKEELKPQGEKCSYLFRGASLEELGEFPSDLQPEYEYDPYCPVHGSRRRLKRRKDKLITMQTLMSSVDNADSADRLPSYIYSQDFIAKIIRKQKRLQMSGDEKRRADKIMQKIKSNLWTISLAFLFLFTAFHGLQNLQTSVNDHLGGDSLMAHYVSLAISSLFVPSFMIDRLGCKQTLIISMSIYTLYIFTNFLPRYYSLIPSSILAGIAGSCLWGAKCAYITECGMRYARLNVEAPNTVIVRFFGYFFMIVHLGQVSGNLISSYILEAAIGFVPPHDQVIDTCGHSYPKNFSELSERAALNLLRPPQSAIVSVCAAYLGCAMVAVMIVAMFLNALHKDTINRTKKPQFNAQILKLSLKNFANVKVLLLIPLTIFNGLEQAFVVGVYTKSFVGCGLGISQIGFVMTAFGVTDAICSLVFGPLIKLFGRTPLFVFGAVINMLMIVTLAIWSLNPTDSLVFYVIAGVWGMADGVWNTQINGFWVALVGRQSLDLAFANYRFWESLGIALGFLLLRFTSVQEFLWISISVLLLGICGYICIELYDLIISYLNMEKLMEMICIWRRKPLPTQEPTSMQVSLLSSTPMATSATQPTSMLTSTTTNPETI